MNRTPVADWQQLSALYELAVALDTESLDDWLGQLEAQAHPLLGQLRDMLHARAQVDGLGFLGTLPKIRLEPEPSLVEWHAGSCLGVYRLQRRVGSGGMADVWLAQRDDGVFDRQVAIKLLFRNERSSARDSFAQRFERERHILASLDHPNIAGLHDAGVTREGQPWLALEYVEGQTLTSWCDARHLGVRERVGLFRQVLLAVQHAHANLVIHRDLKPGNILVTSDGEVRLLDFGIAKLIEPEGGVSVETELTRLAGRPMTPQYAAPEQLLGQPLTTACDVYSLGVVLYELLCGELPYELKVSTPAQLEQAVLDTEPRAPSRRALDESTALLRSSSGPALRKALASDLDAIVLRALAKQPAQRYASVEALRADLDRWLAGEPVLARAPSALDRVGKFVRRHVLAVSMGAAAVVTLAVVAAVAVIMGLQAREDSARAVAARDFMLNIFSRANQEKSRGADITARDLLETGRKDVMTRLAGQPQLQVELLRGIAKIQIDMGEYVTADSTLAELVRIHARSGGAASQAMALADRAANALQMNAVDRAAGLLDEAVSTAGSSRRGPELAAKFGEVQGGIALASGDAAGARAILESARSAASRDLGAASLSAFRIGQALFAAERDLGHHGAALALLQELRATARRFPDWGAAELLPMDWEEINLALSAGRYAQALTLVRIARPKCVEALGEQEQLCRHLLLTLGQIQLRLGDLDEAAQLIQGLQVIEQDARHPFLRIEAMLLELRLGSLAEPPARRADLATEVQAFGRSGSEVAMKPAFKAAALLALGESRLRRDDAAEARRWIDEAFAVLGDPSSRRGGALRIASVARMLDGVALMQQGRPAEALVALAAAESGFVDVLGRAHPLTQLPVLNRALALAQLGRVHEALSATRAAEGVLRESFGANAPGYLQVRRLLNHLEAVPPSDASVSPEHANPQRDKPAARRLPGVPLFFS